MGKLSVSVFRDKSSLPNVLGIEIGERVAYFSGGAGDGHIYATTDGKKLHRRRAPSWGLRGVRLIGDELWVVGEYGTCQVSTDQGATWTPVPTPGRACLWDIARDGKGNLWIGGSDATLLRRTPKATSFTAVKHALRGRDERADPRVEIVPAGVMFLVFNAYWDGKALAKPRGLTGNNCALATAPSGTIVIVGDNGRAFRSTDGGRSYKAVTTGTDEHLNDVAFVDGAFVAVGGKGTIRRSEDDGVSWKALASGVKYELWSIASWGTGAFVGGVGGLLLKLTSDGDTYWKGAPDAFAPKPVVRADVAPLPAPAAAAREARYTKLLAEARAAHAPFARKLAAPKLPVDDHVRAIYDGIDDVEEYKVYADVLQAAGDPRGELIALQAAGQKKPATALLKKHAATFLDGLTPPLGEVAVQITWRWGYVEEAQVGLAEDVFDEADDGACEEALAALLDAPSARFLRRLTLGLFQGVDNDYDDALREIGRRARPALRELFVGDFTSEQTEISWSHLGNVTKLCGALDRLEALTLRSGSMSLGKPGELVFPSLKTLRIITGGLRKDALKCLEKAHLPALEELTLYFGTDNYGCDIALKDLRTLLGSDRFPRLRRLGLCNAELADELCAMLHTSSLVAQVTELDLSHGTLSDTGARALATYAGALAHLAAIDVSRSYLTERGIKVLKQAFPKAKLVASDQRGDGDEFADRYVSVSE